MTLHQGGDFAGEKAFTGFHRFGVIVYFKAGVLVPLRNQFNEDS
ncbi:MAG: hypothetical protein WA376_04360 [Terrimicrobiaceae bacterium]